MEIPKEITDKWKKLRSRGDGKEIAKRLRVSDETISRAFAGKATTAEIFKYMADFYEEREKMINSFMPKKADANHTEHGSSEESTSNDA